MEKYLNIYLTTPASRTLISADGIIAINMNTTSTIKIWYKHGKTITIELSAAMTANDNSAVNYLLSEIAKLQQGIESTSEFTVTNISEIPTPLPGGIQDSTGAGITLTAITIA